MRTNEYPTRVNGLGAQQAALVRTIVAVLVEHLMTSTPLRDQNAQGKQDAQAWVVIATGAVRLGFPGAKIHNSTLG